MKISTKGRYGLRAIVDLAASSIEEHVSLKSIAERQDISENYLEQVFSSLRKANVVKSVKGAQGGYSMAMDPEELSVGFVLKILEGSLSVVDATEENEDSLSIQGLLYESVWAVMNEAVENVVEHIKIADLVKTYNQRNKKGDIMFYI